MFPRRVDEVVDPGALDVGRRGLILAVLIVLALGNVGRARALDASPGPVRFFKVAGSDFDGYTANPSPARQEWMRDHYWRMLTYTPYFDARVSWFPNAWVYADLYAMVVGSSLASEHPEWILRDAAGNPLYIPYRCSGGSCPQYAGDVGDPAFRAHWIAAAAATLAEGYRGLFVDDVNLLLARVSDGGGQSVAPRDPRTGVEMTEANWRRYIAEFVEAIRAAFPGVEIAHNVIWFVGHDDPFVVRALRSADFINLERGVNDAGIRGGRGTYGFETFLGFVDWLHAAGRSVVFDASAGGAGREYGLAAYFLVNEANDGFGNVAQSTPDDWWAGYDVDLGDAKGARYEWRGLVRRDFAHGFVLVNPPDAAEQTVSVKGFDLAGRSRTTVTLVPATGVVLRDACDSTGGSPCKKGRARARCLAESRVSGITVEGVVRCIDGDPSCDQDPAAGQCGFPVGWCFNNSNQPSCAAVGIRRLAVRIRTRPPTVGRSLVAAVTGAVSQLAGADASSQRSRVIFTPPFMETDRCTAPVALTVAVRRRGSRLRFGQLTVQTRAVGSGRARDVDRITLVCDPGQ